MPTPKSYEGTIVGCVVVHDTGPRQGRRTTHWCSCTQCHGDPFLVSRFAIQQALKQQRHLCPNCRISKPRRSRKSYSGREIRCVLVQEPGPDEGRRTTHWCLCRRTGRRFVGKSVNIQQALRCGRQICPYCRSAVVRHNRHDLVGTVFGQLTVESIAGRRGKNAKSADDYWNCVCECGGRIEVAERSLARGRTRSCGCINAPDLTGRKFGRLTVLGPYESDKTDQQRRWLCVCSCDLKSQVIRTTTQLCGARGSCDCGCANRERLKAFWETKRRPIEEIGQYRVFLSLKSSAKKRNLSFHLSQACVAKLTPQPCFYCGTPPSHTLRVPITAHAGPGGTRYIGEYKYSSLDRVDSLRGYEESNVVPACWQCQVAKSDRQTTDFIGWVHRIAARLPQLRERFSSYLEGSYISTECSQKGAIDGE